MDDYIAAMTPEERLAAGLCCECGQDMAGINPPSHAGEHWPEYLRDDGRNGEALKRQKMLREMPAVAPVRRAKVEHQPAKTATTDKPQFKV
jgi:hypothetical protein